MLMASGHWLLTTHFRSLDSGFFRLGGGHLIPGPQYLILDNDLVI